MSRLLKRRRESEPKRPLGELTTDDESGSSGNGLRKALLALGFAGLAYVAARRARRSGSAPSMDEVKETVSGVRSGEGFTIPIGERGESETGAAGSPVETGTTQGAIGNEPMPGEDLSGPETTDQDVSDEDDSERDIPDQDGSDHESADQGEPDQETADEAIEERTEENAHEEPTEPGEMAVDEEITEDVIDGERDEAQAGEADEGEPEAETGDEAEAETDEDEEGA